MGEWPSRPWPADRSYETKKTSIPVYHWPSVVLSGRADPAVGPIPAGVNAFDFVAPAPNPSLLPTDEILGVTVIIVSASYRDKEFVRVGYYVNTYYDDEELNAQVEKDLEEKQASTRPIVWDKLMRNVLIEKPKVTR